MTHLAVPILVDSLEQALADAARAAEHGADLVEFRIDRFTDDPDAVRELVQRAALPCLLTCRPTWEGGEYDGDDQTRVSLLEHAALGARQPAYIDVELAAYRRSANLRQKIGLIVEHDRQQRAVTTGLILSTHDFETRPPDLDRRVAEMAQAPACRVIKVAWRARSLRDNLEAFELLRRRLKPTIALCMGDAGLPSRVLAKKFGALLTFAALRPGAGTAIGQPTLAQLKGLYRWDRLGPATRVYGVIGYPVGHSMSPAIHNAGFDAAGFDGVYLPMPIPPEYEHFKATVGSWLDAPGVDFFGASVTIPHKANLLRFVAERGGEVEPLAQQIGAANTLIRRDDGTLVASNTDYAAALDPVCGHLGVGREQVAGHSVAVLGAGGAARAVVAGFAQHGAAVTVYNRSVGKARALADDFAPLAAAAGGSVSAQPLGALPDAAPGVLINATPLGMHPHVDTTPAPQPPGWGPGTVVFDTVYNPAETRLLREARAAGCATIAGTEMFVRQAAAQFEGWTGQAAPLAVFRRVLGEQLGAP